MQAVLSWGLVLGTGAGLARDTATLILGQYFRSTSTVQCCGGHFLTLGQFEEENLFELTEQFLSNNGGQILK